MLPSNVSVRLFWKYGVLNNCSLVPRVKSHKQRKKKTRTLSTKYYRGRLALDRVKVMR